MNHATRFTNVCTRQMTGICSINVQKKHVLNYFVRCPGGAVFGSLSFVVATTYKSWERDNMLWPHDINLWERHIKSWERDIMSWPRDRFVEVTTSLCRGLEMLCWGNDIHFSGHDFLCWGNNIFFHCFKSAANRFSWRCMKSNTPNISWPRQN